MTATVRRAQPDDADAFAACHLACWRETYDVLWGPEKLAGMDLTRMASRRRQDIEAEVADHFLAEDDGEVIGIAIAGPSRNEDAVAPLELYAIYVRAAHQGSGVSNALLTASLADGPAQLWVYRDNPRASAFYVHHDFIPDGAERTDSMGISEIRMVRRRSSAGATE